MLDTKCQPFAAQLAGKPSMMNPDGGKPITGHNHGGTAEVSEENEQVIELITNQMTWTANTISELYRSRWQIEIFFREIKQLLHIKSFIGTSENAVMIQIWTALITILVLKYLKALSIFGWRLSNLVAFIRLNLFVKIDLQKWLDKPFEEPPVSTNNIIQGVLF